MSIYNKNLIKSAFNEVFESHVDAIEKVCKKYFSSDYIQYVDGEKINFTDFIQHVLTLKSIFSSIKITFKHIIAENDKVSTIHITEGIKKDGTIIKIQINALFQIKERKIILCDELTHLIRGEELDKNLGSIRNEHGITV